MNIIILSGGRSTRFGSNKSAAEFEGLSLLEHVANQFPSHKLIVAGESARLNAQFVQEIPPKGGPSAGIAAAMKLVTSELVGIFAVDAPFAPSFLPILERSIKNDGAVPVDHQKIPQYLAGLYKSERVLDAIGHFDSVHNLSVRKLFSGLVIDFIDIENTELLMDIDTLADLKHARLIVRGFQG